MFKIHFWDQSHVTIVWDTRETGDIHESQNRGIPFAAFWVFEFPNRNIEAGCWLTSLAAPTSSRIVSPETGTWTFKLGLKKAIT